MVYAETEQKRQAASQIFNMISGQISGREENRRAIYLRRIFSQAAVHLHSSTCRINEVGWLWSVFVIFSEMRICTIVVTPTC